MVKISLSNARGTGWISDQGAKIPYDLRPKNRNVKQKRYCHKLNKDFKHGPHQKILKQNKTKQNKKKLASLEEMNLKTPWIVSN